MQVPVNIPAILDSIMLLKESTYQYKAETRGPGGHGPGWTFENHYGRCEIAEQQYDAEMAGSAPPPLECECLCCNAVHARHGHSVCPICEPPTKRKCVLGAGKDRAHSPAYIDVYVIPAPDAQRSEHVACIFNISGHLASLLAMHAYYNTDLLRPGNFAPLYNVSLTSTYFSTMSTGLLFRKFPEKSRRLLKRLLHMMVFHELWVAVDDAYLQTEPSTVLLRTQANTQTNVLFDRHEVWWERRPIDPVKVRALRGQRIDNPELFSKVKTRMDAVVALSLAAPDLHKTNQPISEVHECFGWWLCCQDHFIDDTHVYEACERDRDYGATMVWVPKDATLAVQSTYTHWKVYLTAAELEAADSRQFPAAAADEGAFGRNSRSELRNTMRERADVLMADQTDPTLLTDHEERYQYLLRSGYIVTTKIDSELNYVLFRQDARGHFQMKFGNMTVFIVKHPGRSPLPAVVPPVIDESSRCASITATTSLVISRGNPGLRKIYRPYRWFVQHGP